LPKEARLAAFIQISCHCWQRFSWIFFGAFKLQNIDIPVFDLCQAEQIPNAYPKADKE
jgi:hypothetical protein